MSKIYPITCIDLPAFEYSLLFPFGTLYTHISNFRIKPLSKKSPTYKCFLGNFFLGFLTLSLGKTKNIYSLPKGATKSESFLVDKNKGLHQTTFYSPEGDYTFFIQLSE